jgi:hypothetical protein
MVGFAVVAGLCLGGCNGDDGSSDTTTTTTPTTSTTTTSTDTSTTTSGTSSDASTTASTSDGSSETTMSATTGPTCDPPVVGDWNACIGDAGTPDTSLCNWMGTGQSVGFIGCLTSSSLEGGNVCFIEGCEDACDCFNPPTSGTAEVICADILEGGGMGCALDCSSGQTCPDGMECAGNICFWPPA